MEKITELIKPPIVGCNYLVPCVKSSAVNWTNRTIPVLGDFHFDREIINFPDEHIHIDFRFVSSSEFRRLNHIAGISPFAQVISKEFVEFETWEIRRCNRPMPKFPEQTPKLHITWFPSLEKAYQDKQVTCGKCPHRGIDLRSINGDRSGSKTCPAHGLKWNKQGQLVHQIQH